MDFGLSTGRGRIITLCRTAYGVALQLTARKHAHASKWRRLEETRQLAKTKLSMDAALLVGRAFAFAVLFECECSL